MAAASDNVRDHWHRYGDYDLLEVFGWAVKLAHLDTAPDAGCWAPMVGATPASALGEPQAAALGRLSVGGKPPRYRWHLGCILLKMPAMSLRTGQANIIIFDARKYDELLSRPQTERVVVRGRQVVSGKLPAYSELDALVATPTELVLEGQMGDHVKPVSRGAVVAK